MASGKDDPRNLPSKLSQNWFRSGWDIAHKDICPQDKCSMNKCPLDTCHVFKLVPKRWLLSVVQIGSVIDNADIEFLVVGGWTRVIFVSNTTFWFSCGWVGVLTILTLVRFYDYLPTSWHKTFVPMLGSWLIMKIELYKHNPPDGHPSKY